MLIELSPVLSRFAERTPLPVLARAVLGRVHKIMLRVRDC